MRQRHRLAAAAGLDELGSISGALSGGHRPQQRRRSRRRPTPRKSGRSDSLERVGAGSTIAPSERRPCRRARPRRAPPLVPARRSRGSSDSATRLPFSEPLTNPLRDRRCRHRAGCASRADPAPSSHRTSGRRLRPCATSARHARHRRMPRRDRPRRLPKVGFSPKTPQNAAGMRIEPPASVPTASGQIPAQQRNGAAAAAAAGVRYKFHGLRVTPESGESVSGFQPNSGVVVLPKKRRTRRAQALYRQRSSIRAGSGSIVLRADKARPAAGRQRVLQRHRHAPSSRPCGCPSASAPRAARLGHRAVRVVQHKGVDSALVALEPAQRLTRHDLDRRRRLGAIQLEAGRRMRTQVSVCSSSSLRQLYHRPAKPRSADSTGRTADGSGSRLSPEMWLSSSVIDSCATARSPRRSDRDWRREIAPAPVGGTLGEDPSNAASSVRSTARGTGTATGGGHGMLRAPMLPPDVERARRRSRLPLKAR